MKHKTDKFIQKIVSRRIGRSRYDKAATLIIWLIIFVLGWLFGFYYLFIRG